MIEFHDRHENLTEKIYNGELDLPHRYVFVLTNICNLRCRTCGPELSSAWYEEHVKLYG